MKLIDRKMLKNFDWLLLAMISIVVMFGLVILANASASPYGGDDGAFSFLSKIDFTYVLLQMLWYFVGVAAMIVVSLFDYHSVAEIIDWIYWINVGVLAALIAFGKVTRGITGWILIGDRGIQPSELCKITIIFILAKILSERLENSGGSLGWKDIWAVVWRVGIPLVLVMSQPDWGTAAVYIVILAGMLFVAKISYGKIAIILGSGAALAPVLWAIMADWQRNRILDFLGKTDDATAATKHVEQSKLIIGSGQLKGRGLFNDGALSRLDYLAEDSTDFIFAVTAESLGFIGGVVLIILYFFILFRLLYMATKAKDMFGTLIIIGVMSMMLFHVVENIGMTMGMLPVTGIPLPFFSYGGSSMLTNFLAIGLVQNVLMRRGKKSFNKPVRLNE
ncbi:MAG: FtsW/RodA/SpoVE family cell cycle protein [Christensenellales bacterium]|jgi:rod shape determining protein RodA